MNQDILTISSGPEEELRQIFSRFGTVQTCIVNREKRHAFVKMCDRKGAVAAKEGMEKEQDPIILSRARSVRSIPSEHFIFHANALSFRPNGV